MKERAKIRDVALPPKALSKPFIDDNLQIQLPNSHPELCEAPLIKGRIYSHFASASASLAAPPLFNDADLLQAIKEAECSYEAWKKMQAKIKRAARPAVC